MIAAAACLVPMLASVVGGEIRTVTPEEAYEVAMALEEYRVDFSYYPTDFDEVRRWYGEWRPNFPRWEGWMEQLDYRPSIAAPVEAVTQRGLLTSSYALIFAGFDHVLGTRDDWVLQNGHWLYLPDGVQIPDVAPEVDR